MEYFMRLFEHPGRTLVETGVAIVPPFPVVYTVLAKNVLTS